MLFLDEIGDLSPRNQARLLRAIEMGAFRPVGARDEVAVDIRVVAASNIDLFEAVQTGTFRADLYYRLCGIEIGIPALRERREDIPVLASHFAHEYADQTEGCPIVFSGAAIEFLLSLPWPGNIRELRNCIRRLSALLPGERISVDDVALLVRRQVEPDKASGATSIRDMEADHIRRVLRECNGHLSDAASRLGVHRNTLRKKIKRYGLEP